MEGFQDIGQRIVQAARLAVAVHFYESVARHTSPDQGEALRVARQILRRRVETGGAGEHAVADDGSDESATTAAASLKSSRLGDLVTDDERDGLMGCDATQGDDVDDNDDDASARDPFDS